MDFVMLFQKKKKIGNADFMQWKSKLKFLVSWALK